MDLPDHLKDALRRLGEDPTEGFDDGDLLHQLTEYGLIERTSGGGIRFTELGKKIFRDLRGTWPKKNL